MPRSLYRILSRPCPIGECPALLCVGFLYPEKPPRVSVCLPLFKLLANWMVAASTSMLSIVAGSTSVCSAPSSILDGLFSGLRSAQVAPVAWYLGLELVPVASSLPRIGLRLHLLLPRSCVARLCLCSSTRWSILVSLPDSN